MKKDKLSKNEKKVLKMWGIALLSIIVILVIINIFFPLKTLFASIVNSNIDSTKSGEVNDYSRYSTVSGAIDKFYAYLNQKDYDAVIKILESSYVKNNKITEDNIDDFLTISDSQLAFSPGIMYLLSGKNGIEKYYVEGTIVYANLEEDFGKQYYQVILDSNNDQNLKLFSIKPITQKEYEKGVSKL